ncbi:MAG TPA: SPOR domain-containing protein [Gemmatimonadales bacterium]|nr:SPOR domain-containing protein [Gemmatimonadales bacterium]
MTRHRAVAGACLALAAACGGSPDAPDQAPVFTPSSPATSLVRLPVEGGLARAYSVPDLEPIEWEPQARLPGLERLVGVNGEQGIVFAVDTRSRMAILDLPSGRVRSALANVRAATVAADGLLYTVDSGGVVHAYGRRTPERFQSRIEGPPPRLHGAVGGRVLAVSRQGGELSVLAPRDSVAIRPIAEGPVAVTLWGDLLAVATDTAVRLYDPQGRRPEQTLELENGARALAFSPSGHQLYVAQDDGGIAMVERFSLDVISRIELPERVDHLRSGPFGRWLLAHAEGSDSVWVIDLAGEPSVEAIVSGWADDLPLVTASSVLVVRQGDDVVAFEPTGGAFTEQGRIEDGAKDLWVAPPWTPTSAPIAEAKPSDDPAETPGPLEGDTLDGGERVYLQVSSSRNPEWARELSDKLTAAGLPARVLEPPAEGDAYRVVLGPYPSREAAEASGRSLGMPFFVISAGEADTP